MRLSSHKRPLSTIANRYLARYPGPYAYYKTSWQVPGWFDDLDFLVFVAIGEHQRRMSCKGDLLEIGAYAGKSAILMEFLRNENEQLIVCDIFDNAPSPAADQAENKRWYGLEGAPRRTFEHWYRRYHRSLPTIIESPSSALSDMSFPIPFRFVHVDGSHVYQTVRADLDFTRTHAAPGAVIALDDYGRAHAPGVAAAAWEAMFDAGLSPVLQTNGKLYVQWQQDEDLRSFLCVWATGLGLRLDRHAIPGGEVYALHYEQRPPSRLAHLSDLLMPPIVPRSLRFVRRAWAMRVAAPRRSSSAE